ncbi:MAG: hypothetical protein Q7W55_07135 [Pseudohongiella sp.]|nr:hypothetical protein [Pseudohongiella sp.]
MARNSFGNIVWVSLFKSWGPVLGLIGVTSIIASYFWTPSTDMVSLRWLLILIFVFLYLLTVTTRLSWLAYNESEVVPLKVKFAKEPPSAFTGAHALLLLEPTPNLAHEALVSIYYLENEIEKLAGLGKVINVQNDGKVQVLVIADYEFGEKLEPIKQNSVDELKKLILKTSIPSFILEDQIHG